MKCSACSMRCWFGGDDLCVKQLMIQSSQFIWRHAQPIRFISVGVYFCSYCKCIKDEEKLLRQKRRKLFYLLCSSRIVLYWKSFLLFLLLLLCFVTLICFHFFSEYDAYSYICIYLVCLFFWYCFAQQFISKCEISFCTISLDRPSCIRPRWITWM